MPIVEIVSWPASDTYLANPKVLLPGIEYLKKEDGCINSFSGLVNEDGKTLYLLNIWETTEHCEASVKQDGYPSIIGSNASVGEGGILTRNHVQFVHDFNPALEAPCTELLVFNLKEGKTAQDVYQGVDGIAVKVHEINPQHAPVTYGQVLETSDRRVYALLGWDSREKHLEIVAGSTYFKPWVEQLRDASVFKMVHVNLEKHF